MVKLTQTFVKGCAKLLYLQKWHKSECNSQCTCTPIHVFNKEAVPRLQNRGRALASTIAGKHWSHTSHTRMGKYRPGKMLLLKLKTAGLRPSSPSSYSNLLQPIYLCLNYVTCLPTSDLKLLSYKIQKENTEEINTTEVLLNKSNIQSCNYEEVRKARTLKL